mmetsp:Transcript_43637/g.102923  ORF Transcript_43637/g.102923 Transcript_43637/m.102923 type:complete len:605 (+) Transcript_43637:121-1935(+)
MAAMGGQSALEGLLTQISENASDPSSPFQGHVNAMLGSISRNDRIKQALAQKSYTRMQDRIRRQVEQARAEDARREESRLRRQAELQARRQAEQAHPNAKRQPVPPTRPIQQTRRPSQHSVSTAEGPDSVGGPSPDSSRSGSTDSGQGSSPPSPSQPDIAGAAAAAGEVAAVDNQGQGLPVEESTVGVMTRRPAMQRESASTFSWSGPLSLGLDASEPAAASTAAADSGTEGLKSPQRRMTMATVGGVPTVEKWPADVQMALDVSHVVHAAAQLESAPIDEQCQQLRLVGSGCSIPHPEKGGEAVYAVLPEVKGGGNGADSYYFDSVSNSMGVADGVGEWEWRFKISARAFADELMEGSKVAAQTVDASATRNLGAAAVEMLQAGYDTTKSFGAATAIVAKLGNESGNLGVASLGDSSLIALRPESIGHHRTYRIFARTTEQQHEFNCPFQLSRLPAPADYQRLVNEGRQQLVMAVARMKNTRLDYPGDACCYNLSVERGDLVLMGTDGIFDNLYDEELKEICECATSPWDVNGLAGPKPPREVQHPLEEELASRLAIAVARAAFLRSLDRNAKTPFGENARREGGSHSGGKMDDITVVAAWVV